jgi:hypothetical protein
VGIQQQSDKAIRNELVDEDTVSWRPALPHKGRKMRKLTAILLVVVAPVLFVGALWSLLNGIFATYVAFETRSAYASGAAVGGFFMALLLFLIARKSFRAGLMRHRRNKLDRIENPTRSATPGIVGPTA